MRAFLKILYAFLALSVLTILVDNKFFDGQITGINKSIVSRLTSFFSGESYETMNNIATVHRPDQKNCLYYLKSESGIFIPEKLEEDFQIEGLRVRVEWKELLRVQDECKRGTYVRIQQIKKFQ